ncbi:hypothetical protein NliqN6_5666 [Naganishia liquefaciens]|uniref:F-box domain-containing protein n=1 Tax=Naganishia liquefaciens TaxID=104408 RepID=A0A8H3TY52_9TREE|nr:hypothetical protein NliqN6_5666 [Naganishia liquefaciens]
MSSLLHTALANRQAASHPSPSKRFSRLSIEEGDGVQDGEFVDEFDDDDDEDEDELVDLQTRPGTPVPGGPRSAGLPAKVALKSPTRDPLRVFPSALAVRIFLQLDIKSLARCNRVSKRWRKSSTLNYTWFLHCRALTLPQPPPTHASRRLPTDPDPDDPNSGYDPYLKHRGLPLVTTPIPTSATPQWSKRESKRDWRPAFRDLVMRKPEDAERRDPLNVDVEALSASVSEAGSGYSTPGGNNDSWGGSGAGTPATRSKKEMRAHYKSLNGRKSKSKGMLGGVARGHKDLGGMGGGEDQFSAPF